MQTEYSAGDIAAARSLRTFTYIYTSAATFWTYDYVCSLYQELTFLTQSRWTKVKGLYILTRYMPLLLFVGHLYLNFVPNNNPDECQMINNICSCFFIIRTYALWNQNKSVLIAMLIGFIAVIVASVGVLFSATADAPFDTSTIPGITGCYQSTGSDEMFVPFVLLFALELARAPLYDVLLKHNIFYYLCGLFFSMVNALTCLLLQYAYNAMFQDFQLIILAILATRMHLHLWHVDRRTRFGWIWMRWTCERVYYNWANLGSACLSFYRAFQETGAMFGLDRLCNISSHYIDLVAAAMISQIDYSETSNPRTVVVVMQQSENHRTSYDLHIGLLPIIVGVKC
ncbi:uncharacterized protein EDB93DRAFT_1106089 [Suillus bovinus]|uniref:uncharacterized protein n=1 Tax=Suillus bovinus TaxID=48563 RepID=UPI001B872E62|nr:uncharacterized protein EDB93DRAFT_1106089 [Suillus bovinus]KAG2139600.1 hypothetical protein EDB93DRAFT_1106089 [Suillus bovinus]